jgi:hypothetical protein
MRGSGEFPSCCMTQTLTLQLFELLGTVFRYTTSCLVVVYGKYINIRSFIRYTYPPTHPHNESAPRIMLFLNIRIDNFYTIASTVPPLTSLPLLCGLITISYCGFASYPSDPCNTNSSSQDS